MLTTIAGIGLGVGLAAAAGFRVFLPLLALSIATYYNIVPVSDEWVWLGSSTALIILLVATILEIGAYFIPFFDNLLDSIAIPLATVAGTLIVAATSMELDPIFTWTLAIIAGGGTAGVLKTANAKVRLTSSATTAGVGNPFYNSGETLVASGMSVLSIIFWPLAFIVAILMVLFAIFAYRKVKKFFDKRFSRES